MVTAAMKLKDTCSLEEKLWQFGDSKVVLAGGVMCNSIIKNMLKERYDVCFAEPSMSADNAVGVAVLALRAYKSEKTSD